jgi:SAM-dependent methyltransferases related to tRNA (uracil-5-)-methyltransferase
MKYCFFIDIYPGVWYYFTMDNLKKNQILRVIIDAYSAEAVGICHVDGFAVFVPGTIAGEEWEIRILKVQKNYAYARGEKLLVPSPARIDPGCCCYGKCGGGGRRPMAFEDGACL